MKKSCRVITGAAILLLGLTGCTTLSKEDAARLDKASADSAQALTTANQANETAKAAQTQAASAEAAARAAQSDAAAAAQAAKDAAAAAEAARQAKERMMNHGMRK
jgi:hypothetical protein